MASVQNPQRKHVSPTLRFLAKLIVWLFLGILLLELALRTAGATYLLLKDPQNKLSKYNTQDAYIILALGESTTQNGGGYSWPSQLETILNERSSEKTFTVVNGGVGGTNTAFILSHLEGNLDKYSPDLVITMMGENDGTWYMVYENTLRSRTLAPLEGLRIYTLGRWMWAALHPSPERTGSQDESDSREWVEGLKEEEAKFKKTLEINPSNGSAYVGLGWVYYRLGTLSEEASLLEEAEKMFRKAIELDVPAGQIYDGLGMTYEARGMYGEAIGAYEKLLELSQAGVIDGGLNERAYVQLGRLYYPGHQPESEIRLQHDLYNSTKAEEMFKQALEINPNNSDAYNGVGWVYYFLSLNSEETHVVEEAEKMFRKAIDFEVPDRQLDEGYGGYEGLGLTYESRGMYQEAIETYEKIMELSKTGLIHSRLEEWAYTRLGWLYHETGVPDEEIEEFYKKTGLSFRVPRNNTVYEITKHHYRELYHALKTRDIKYIAMQYPTRSVDDLKKMFNADDDVTFMSNEENFRQALAEGTYEEYFIDRCYDDFGHATPKGNRLIAENVAEVILADLEI